MLSRRLSERRALSPVLSIRKQPVPGGTGHKDSAFMGVAGLAVGPVSQGVQQAVCGAQGVVAGIVHEDAAGAVVVLGDAGLKTARTTQGAVLVAGNSGNRSRCP